MEGRGGEEAVNILLLPVEDTLVLREEDGNKKVSYCIANVVLGIQCICILPWWDLITWVRFYLSVGVFFPLIRQVP